MLSALRRSSRVAAVPRTLQGTSSFRSTSLALAARRTLITKAYTQDHELVAFDDETKIGTVSITDYAQSSLGDVVFVELPTVGSKVTQGDQIGAVESVKAASDIYAPVSGIIEAVNETLDGQPGLINKAPETDGWLCKIKLSEPEEVKSLMDAESYKTHCSS